MQSYYFYVENKNKDFIKSSESVVLFYIKSFVIKKQLRLKKSIKVSKKIVIASQKKAFKPDRCRNKVDKKMQNSTFDNN